ncbi:YeiH family protein [Porphyromonas circumdentaria]|uniref:Conserved hypothetical integral membrane protein n=1 Tax=Porphyromonas circumdentaria TaxID=29524 RepID=A0A1T4MKM9_9PORP|nr:putative sulfate exporter family transporter [Porphyromonas circumdentaria]MBB6275841.1 putative integral membrane protein (TIGR00698 family) [Porphyromonas circumdentaria]MDO4722385.1 putative sulfate exporter family transporter [Porphyromonas circumdentaria]SJZ67375.1 conserved hypothetical integral membrane protein [Porphyromonas circumdentaria]
MKRYTQQYSRPLYGGVIVLLIILLLASYTPLPSYLYSWVKAPIVLLIGLLFASLLGTPYKKFNNKASKKLLQWSIIGLGFGMNLQESLSSGIGGMSFTILSVALTLVVGMFIGVKWLGVDRKTSYLISSGTAICGGSAIAAVGPSIKANEESMSVALGSVFILNAVALFIFPSIGSYLSLGQHDFGTWAAIAIHDTSSVVGAGATYGEAALETATMIKLTRALWIIPVAFISSFIFKEKGSKVNIPWFILYFVIAILINTYLLSSYPEIGKMISSIARKGMILAMFFIGATLSPQSLKNIGVKPFLLALSLWVLVSISSLLIIYLL